MLAFAGALVVAGANAGHAAKGAVEPNTSMSVPASDRKPMATCSRMLGAPAPRKPSSLRPNESVTGRGQVFNFLLWIDLSLWGIVI